VPSLNQISQVKVYPEAVIVTEASTISITKLSIKDTVLRKTFIYTI